jgi:hypothetical protein
MLTKKVMLGLMKSYINLVMTLGLLWLKYLGWNSVEGYEITNILGFLIFNDICVDNILLG